MKCQYCHERIIPDLQARVAMELPEGNIIVHEHPCAEEVRKEMKRGEMAKVLQRLSAAIIVLVIISFFAGSAWGADGYDPKRHIMIPDDSEDVKEVRGCLITLRNSASPLYNKFVRLANKTTMSEDGEAEIWGYDPENVPDVSHDDIRRPVNVPAAMFVPMGQHATIRGRLCKCQLWQQSPGVSAER